MFRMGSLLVGGLIGAGMAMLMSPRNGEEMRRELTNKLNDRYGDQIERGRLRATELMQSGREVFDEKLAMGQDLVNTALEKARTTIDEVRTTALPAAESKDDETPKKEADEKVASGSNHQIY